MKKAVIITVAICVLAVAGVVFYKNLSIPSELAASNAIPPVKSNSISKEGFEAFLKMNAADEQIAQAYRFAYENSQNVLLQVRCYCGCLEQGHDDNRACFFNDEER